MNTRILLKPVMLCSALALFGAVPYAQSSETLEDATTKADEAAETEAMAAEAVAEEQAKKLQEEADIDQAEVRGKPMQEVEVSGEN
jgi:hypothetical protein